MEYGEREMISKNDIQYTRKCPKCGHIDCFENRSIQKLLLELRQQLKERLCLCKLEKCVCDQTNNFVIDEVLCVEGE